ncbi:MAG: VCBS repeat-containing protein, partial [Pyrinomonadaceae bacterium]
STGITNMNGEWKPTDHTSGDTFASPAPPAPYSSPATSGSSTFASTFGTSATSFNGTWSLYGVDDVNGDSATISGWKITFEPNDIMCCSCPFSRAEITYSPDNPAVPVCTCLPPSRARADFDGDSKTDLSVFRPSEGNWYMFNSTAGFGVVHWGLNGDQLAPGDYDGDAKADFAVFRPNADSTQPDFYVLKSSNYTYSGYSWGLPGDVPIVADYDGDAKDDLAIYRPADHTFYVFKSNGGSVLSFSGISSGVPVAGDFDGDGKADFVTFNDGDWFIAKSTLNFASVSSVHWGAAGDKPVPADYDGDGKEDLAVFRPSERVWYILRSATGVFITQFGLSDDIPVPGDYDGDSKDDLAVYRDGTWYMNRSTAGLSILQFGLSGDIPIPNRYLP